MSDHPSLFDFAERYPNQPGHRRTATSKAAAAAIKPRAKSLCDQVLEILKAYDPGYTTDEVAAMMGKSVLSIRPRFSQLKTKGLIFDSGITRKNDSGVQASVWRAF